MAKAIHPNQAELDAGQKRGEATRQHEPHARAVRFDPISKRYTLELVAGAEVSFLADQVSELAEATPDELADVALSPSGGALSWPRMDVDISLTGLLMDLVAGVGWRTHFRGLLLREVAVIKSDAKAKAARLNGTKGGRPRKAVGG